MRKETVFVLRHRHVSDDKTDDSVIGIGVYSTNDAIRAAIKRVGGASGFIDHPERFEIVQYEVDVSCRFEDCLSWKERRGWSDPE